ncbi:MAG TPA: hypothetical protein VFZ62_00785, partial [Candidatus Saccharimonadales bacterium]
MIRFLADAEAQAAAGVIVSFVSLLLALFARNKRAVVLSIAFTVLMVLAALDLMTDNMVIVGLAEVMGAAALILLVLGLVFVWRRKALAISGHLFIAAFFGLMSTNLGIERFSSRTEWWNNFNTFQDWATGATLILLLPAVVAAVVTVRSVVGSLRTRGSSQKAAH